MLGNFSSFFAVKKIFHECYQSVRQFGSRSGPRLSLAWSRFKMFANFKISRRQNLSLADKELNMTVNGNFLQIWAMTCDFQQCGILTCVDSNELLQPPFKLRNSKWCSVSSLTIIESSRDTQRLWSDCAYAQAVLRLYWSHIPHCWKSHALAHLTVLLLTFWINSLPANVVFW